MKTMFAQMLISRVRSVVMSEIEYSFINKGFHQKKFLHKKNIYANLIIIRRKNSFHAANKTNTKTSFTGNEKHILRDYSKIVENLEKIGTNIKPVDLLKNN